MCQYRKLLELDTGAYRQFIGGKWENVLFKFLHTYISFTQFYIVLFGTKNLSSMVLLKKTLYIAFIF